MIDCAYHDLHAMSSRRLVHVLMVWCIVYYLGRTCSPTVISENKCCADIKKYGFYLP